MNRCACKGSTMRPSAIYRWVQANLRRETPLIPSNIFLSEPARTHGWVRPKGRQTAGQQADQLRTGQCHGRHLEHHLAGHPKPPTGPSAPFDPLHTVPRQDDAVLQKDGPTGIGLRGDPPSAGCAACPGVPPGLWVGVGYEANTNPPTPTWPRSWSTSAIRTSTLMPSEDASKCPNAYYES